MNCGNLKKLYHSFSGGFNALTCFCLFVLAKSTFTLTSSGEFIQLCFFHLMVNVSSKIYAINHETVIFLCDVMPYIYVENQVEIGPKLQQIR